MAFKKKEKTKKEETKKDIEIYLDEVFGGVALRATSGYEEDWIIMFFKDGEFKRFHNLPPHIGIKVDSKGRIIEGKVKK